MKTKTYHIFKNGVLEYTDNNAVNAFITLLDALGMNNSATIKQLTLWPERCPTGGQVENQYQMNIPLGSTPK